MRAYAPAPRPPSRQAEATPPRPRRPASHRRPFGLPERVLGEPVGSSPAGRSAAWSSPRILFAGTDRNLPLLDEPTNHLDADSPHLAARLPPDPPGRPGGDPALRHGPARADVVNRVFHLDATRATIDIHNTDWRTYLCRPAGRGQAARTRERASAERQGRRPARPGRPVGRPAPPPPPWPGAWSAGRPDAGRTGASPAHRRPPGSGCPSPPPADAPRSARSQPASPSPTAATASSTGWTWLIDRGSRLKSCSASTAPARPPCCASSPAPNGPTAGGA